MRTAIGYILFILVQIVFVPLAIIGVLIVYYKQVYVSKKLGVSSTAVEIINGRWTMDKFGLRKDRAAVRLNEILPNTSTLGLWLALYPLYLLKKITGKNKIYPVFKEAGKETIADLVISRTAYFDQILEKYLADSEQFVVMGAGFDTRCYSDFIQGNVALFELDQGKTQQLKIEYLKQAKIDTDGVHFVEVDFTTEHWNDKLVKAGYDEKKKTIFLWEGVTLYLSEQDVRNTLREIKEHSANGSVVAADFYAEKFVKGEMYPGMKKGLQTLKITNEELGFGIPFDQGGKEALVSFIESEKIYLGDVHYMGSKTKKGTWMVVAELIV